MQQEPGVTAGIGEEREWRRVRARSVQVKKKRRNLCIITVKIRESWKKLSELPASSFSYRLQSRNSFADHETSGKNNLSWWTVKLW